MQEYLITWTVEIEAETPLEAVQAALAMQRDPYSMEHLFGVGFYKNNRWHDEEIDLGYDNPFGRPPAVIGGTEVCCGHCGSTESRYLERSANTRSCGPRTPGMRDTDRILTMEEGSNPRVWCGEVREGE